MYAIASAAYSAKYHVSATYRYEKYLFKFNVGNLKFPLDPKDVSNFEELNPDIAVTVLHYDDDRVIVPLVHSTHLGRKHEVNLFLLPEECKTADGNLTVAAAIRNYRYHYK